LHGSNASGFAWRRIKPHSPTNQGESDGAEEAFEQVVRFEQSEEFQKCGGVRHALGGQINAGKSPQRLTVVEGIFEDFVGQAIPLLEEIDPQYALQPDGQASALAFGIERLDDRQQFGPWNNGLHAREELLAARDLLFRQTRLVRNSAGASCLEI
jgi:hypothetical protein